METCKDCILSCSHAGQETRPACENKQTAKDAYYGPYPPAERGHLGPDGPTGPTGGMQKLNPLSAKKIDILTKRDTMENQYILVKRSEFENLLNCLANQKYIKDIGPTDMSRDEIRASIAERQKAIDDAYNRGMKLLRGENI